MLEEMTSPVAIGWSNEPNSLPNSTTSQPGLTHTVFTGTS